MVVEPRLVDDMARGRDEARLVVAQGEEPKPSPSLELAARTQVDAVAGQLPTAERVATIGLAHEEQPCEDEDSPVG